MIIARDNIATASRMTLYLLSLHIPLMELFLSVFRSYFRMERFWDKRIDPLLTRSEKRREGEAFVQTISFRWSTYPHIKYKPNVTEIITSHKAFNTFDTL